MEFQNFIEGREEEREFELASVRYIVAQMYNSSGNMKKGRRMNPKDLFPLSIDKPKATKKNDPAPTGEQIKKSSWLKVSTPS